MPILAVTHCLVGRLKDYLEDSLAQHSLNDFEGLSEDYGTQTATDNPSHPEHLVGSIVLCIMQILYCKGNLEDRS